MNELCFSRRNRSMSFVTHSGFRMCILYNVLLIEDIVSYSSHVVDMQSLRVGDGDLGIER